MGVTQKYSTALLSETNVGDLVAVSTGNGYEIGIVLNVGETAAFIGILVTSPGEETPYVTHQRVDTLCLRYADGWEIEPVFDHREPADYSGVKRQRRGTLSINGSAIIVNFASETSSQRTGGAFNISTAERIDAIDYRSIPMSSWRLWHSAADRASGREPIYDAGAPSK